MKFCGRLGDEPFLISFLVQCAIFFFAQCSLWDELLSEKDVKVSLYQVALSELRAWDFERDFVKALQAERRATGIEFFDWQREKVKKSKNSLIRYFSVIFSLTPTTANR